MIGWMLDGAVDWLNGIVADVLNAAWKLLTATLFHIPDVTGLPQVQTLTSRSLMVVNTAYVLAIIAAGIVIMTAGTVQARYGAQELLPRLVLGIVAANLAVWISKTIVGAGNALVLGLTGQGIASGGSLKQLLRVMTSTLANPVIGLLSAIIGLIIAVLVLLLISGWITRFAGLIVLCGIAPIALACHGLPWTDALAQLWWKAMGGIVATVVLQAVALNVSLAIYLDPNSNLSAIWWLPADPTGLLNLLIIACLLWFAVRLPGMVRRFVTQSGNKQNVMGAIVRLVIVQQLTRGLGRALSTARQSATGAAGAAAGGRHGGGPRGGGSGGGFGPRRTPPSPGGPGTTGPGHGRAAPPHGRAGSSRTPGPTRQHGHGQTPPRPGQPAGPPPAGPRGTGWPGWGGSAGRPGPASSPRPPLARPGPPPGAGRTAGPAALRAQPPRVPPRRVSPPAPTGRPSLPDRRTR